MRQRLRSRSPTCSASPAWRRNCARCTCKIWPTWKYAKSPLAPPSRSEAGDATPLAQPLADVFREPGLAKELRTVHLQNLADLEIRKIATRATIHPLVQSFPVPANSDYYPYLDLNAARYRFLQQGAGDLAGLNASSVPVIPMLEGTNTLPQVSLDGADY